ncbi:MAG TPA: Hpt domain-containing protein [Holophagaceae bacterium]|nr:Hpt domain-containing protein [Holophagaceae bacterium]
MADRDAIQAQLAALKTAFLSQLGSRLDELEAAWRAGDYAEVHRQAHKLAGTAGTFGVPEVSTLARTLEHRLTRAREGAELSEPEREEAAGFLRRLREAAPK